MSRDRPGAEVLWLAILRWRGVALIAVAIVVTIWLGATNQLILYINPRYVVFTLIMALVALVLLVASFIVRAAHSHEDARPTRSQKVTTVLGGVVTVALAVGMVIVPPATLSSATAIQRDVGASTIGSTTLGSTTQTVSGATSASRSTFERFSVEDWSSLLRQTSDPGFYAGKPANVIGFITPDADDPANLFYLTRFVITCCAVDAQPVAVPVYLAGWKTRFAANAWVKVTGGFGSDPSTGRSAQIALVPTAVTVVTQPTQPYLF